MDANAKSKKASKISALADSKTRTGPAESENTRDQSPELRRLGEENEILKDRVRATKKRCDTLEAALSICKDQRKEAIDNLRAVHGVLSTFIAIANARLSAKDKQDAEITTEEFLKDEVAALQKVSLAIDKHLSK